MPYQKQINYLSIKNNQLSFKTNMLWANSSKTSMGYFYRKPLVRFHANHLFILSMPTISVIVATTSQNLMVFIKYLVTIFHFWVKHFSNFLSG